MDEFLDAPGAISRRDLFRLTLGGGSGLALGGLLDVSGDAGRDEGPEALGRQRVHHLLQLLLVRLRHDRRRPRRQAVEDGGRLRPHRQSRVAVRQGHLDVRDARLAATGSRRRATGRRAATTGRRSPGTTRSRASRRRSARRATRRGSPPRRWMRLTCRSIARRVIGSRTPHTSSLTRAAIERCPSIGPTPSASWAARRTPTRSVTSFRRRPACWGWPTSNIRPGFDIAPRSPVWGPRSVEEP